MGYLVSCLFVVLLACAVFADTYCQCVGYVESKAGLTTGHGNADQLGPYLESVGYKRSDSPTKGCIAIFQPCFGGVDPTYGHIGFIIDWATSPFAVQVRGANQGCTQTSWHSACFDDAGCTDVSDAWFSSSQHYTPSCVAYYSK